MTNKLDSSSLIYLKFIGLNFLIGSIAGIIGYFVLDYLNPNVPFAVKAIIYFIFVIPMLIQGFRIANIVINSKKSEY